MPRYLPFWTAAKNKVHPARNCFEIRDGILNLGGGQGVVF
jgi:hypothetical protein